MNEHYVIIIVAGVNVKQTVANGFLSGFANALGIGVNEDEESPLLRLPQNRKDRQSLIEEWCDYYLLHLEDFRRPKSIDVLIELFDC